MILKDHELECGPQCVCERHNWYSYVDRYIVDPSNLSAIFDNCRKSNIRVIDVRLHGSLMKHADLLLSDLAKDYGCTLRYTHNPHLNTFNLMMNWF